MVKDQPKGPEHSEASEMFLPAEVSCSHTQGPDLESLERHGARSEPTPKLLQAVLLSPHAHTLLHTHVYTQVLKTLQDSM